jgi:hypothetical protein
MKPAWRDLPGSKMARTLIRAVWFAAGWVGALCLAELVIAVAAVALVSGVTLAEFLTILAIVYPSPAASRDGAEVIDRPLESHLRSRLASLE